MPFSKFLSEKTFTFTSIEIFGQGKIEGKIDAICFVYGLNIYLETSSVIKNIKNKPPVVHRVKFSQI